MTPAELDQAAMVNPPTAPVGCETCGAAVGARCLSGTGFRTRHVHAARQRAVRAWLEAQHDTGVADMAAYRARRRAREGRARAIGISTPVT